MPPRKSEAHQALFSRLTTAGGPEAAAACVLVYDFKTRAVNRNVSVTHHNAEWVLYLDGTPEANEKHSKWSIFQKKNLQLLFDIPIHAAAGSGEPPASGVLNMVWDFGGPSWNYSLVVNDVHIVPSWTKAEGSIDVQPPEVVGPSLSLAALPASPARAPVAEPPMLTDEEIFTPMPSFPTSTPNRVDLLALPPAPAMEEPQFVIFDVTKNSEGAMLTCCQQVSQTPNNSRAMIVSPSPYAYSGGATGYQQLGN